MNRVYRGFISCVLAGLYFTALTQIHFVYWSACMKNPAKLFRKPESLIAFVCLAILFAGCTPKRSATPSAAIPNPDHIKISFQPIMAFAPLLIAKEEGVFEHYGLAAEFVSVASTNETIPLLMQGQLDIAQVALSPGMFNAIAKGGSARIVMGITQWSKSGCSAIGLATRVANVEKYRDRANWAGAKIATDPVGGNGLQGLLLARLLAQAGLTVDDVTIETLPPANAAEALQSGAIDMVLLSEPWLTRVVSTAHAEVFLAGRDVLPDGQVSVIAFSERLLKNRALGVRAVNAVLEGLRRYQAGSTERNVAIVAKYTKLAPELIQQVCWADLPADGKLNIDSIMEYQNWAVAQGLLDAPVRPKAFWDDRLVTEALRDGK
jgi:NitT/TauT family transport system substrate-binding protein